MAETFTFYQCLGAPVEYLDIQPSLTRKCLKYIDSDNQIMLEQFTVFADLIQPLLGQANTTPIILQPVTDQAASATFVEATSGLLVAISGIFSAMAALMVKYLEGKSRTKGLTAQEKNVLHAFQTAQLGAQKVTENIGEFKILGSALMKMPGLTQEQKDYLNKEIAPQIDDSTERIKTARAQVDAMVKIGSSLMGNQANINGNPNLPRESGTITAKLLEA